MVERRKNKRRKDDVTGEINSIPEKASKEEFDIAKWIRDNVPSKKTKFDRNHIVEYFTGSRAVDALLQNSPWSKTKFESRQQVIDILEIMLRHKFFHRAKKVIITENELSKVRATKKKSKEMKMDAKIFQKDENKDKPISKGQNDLIINGSAQERVIENKEYKKKPKVRLEMHMEQYFVDCNDAYVWIYEPIPIYYWLFGTLLVLGAIAVCLFPLWPLTVRHGVWYLSIAAAGFLVLIISLIIIRMIVFCILWLLTFGRHHLWILPNLVEDVGFLASFWPLYSYEYYGSCSNHENKSSQKKKQIQGQYLNGGEDTECSDSWSGNLNNSETEQLMAYGHQNQNWRKEENSSHNSSANNSAEI